MRNLIHEKLFIRHCRAVPDNWPDYTTKLNNQKAIYADFDNLFGFMESKQAFMHAFPCVSVHFRLIIQLFHAEKAGTGKNSKKNYTCFFKAVL